MSAMRRDAGSDLRSNRYANLSRQPLHSLLFVLPALAFFHVGLIRTPDVLKAHHDVGAILHFLGAAGPLLPAAGIIGVLLIQHAFSGARWRVHPLALGGMLLESVAWSLPIVAMLHVMGLLTAAGPSQPSTFNQLVIIAGAGIYEEFVFRLVLIGLLLLLLVDAWRGPKPAMAIIVLSLTAVVFSLYHPQVWAGPTLRSGLLWRPFLFRALAGGYLGGVFLLRGYGITVGAHIVYNVYAVLVLG